MCAKKWGGGERKKVGKWERCIQRKEEWDLPLTVPSFRLPCTALPQSMLCFVNQPHWNSCSPLSLPPTALRSRVSCCFFRDFFSLCCSWDYSSGSEEALAGWCPLYEFQGTISVLKPRVLKEKTRKLPQLSPSYSNERQKPCRGKPWPLRLILVAR